MHQKTEANIFLKKLNSENCIEVESNYSHNFNLVRVNLPVTENPRDAFTFKHHISALFLLLKLYLPV